jgi:hypothetical protein
MGDVHRPFLIEKLSGDTGPAYCRPPVWVIAVGGGRYKLLLLLLLLLLFSKDSSGFSSLWPPCFMHAFTLHRPGFADVCAAINTASFAATVLILAVSSF